MNVESSIFYHVHKPNKYDSLWVPGNVLFFERSQRNEFIAFYDQNRPSFIINNIQCAPSYAAGKMVELATQMPLQGFINFINWSRQIFKEDGMYIRERIFEDVRLERFAESPSRMSCL